MTIHQRAFTHAEAARASPAPPGGAYGWLTPHIATIAAHNDDIAARALNLKRDELHFIAMTLALMGDAREDADHVAAFARGLGLRPRKPLLAEFAPGVDKTLVKLAPKLAGDIWRASSYVRLAELWDEFHARCVLAHLPKISRRHVATLMRLPPSYRTRGVLRMVGKRGDLAEVCFAIELVRRIRTDLTDRQIMASLHKADGASIRQWVMRHYERVPFPAAPTGAIFVEGVEVLRPLTCYDDLARAAREFDNCIRDYVLRVLRGDAYFYRYAPEAGGKGVAIVELRRVPAIGWVVHEALGPKNERITGVARGAILAAFREAGVGAAPQAAHPQAWFDLD